jgi:O-6-methylguanine DNA methyltransferase
MKESRTLLPKISEPKMIKNQTTIHMFELPISTGDGEFVARYSDTGLCGLEFPDENQRKEKDAQAPDRIRGWHALTRKALTHALAGRVPESLPPIDLSAGTEFQRRVWETLREIASGQTWTYARVAKAIGKPKAVRAVGGACGANPIPVFIPCHRVLAANSRLGGFSGGLNWKRILLGREGITLAE